MACFPDAPTFASAFGQAVWLMTISKDHRKLHIEEIEELVTPAVLLQQFKIYMKGKQPIAFLSWATVSDDVKARMDAGNRKLELHEWRSGPNIEIVECVSPFASTEEIKRQFLENIHKSKNKS
ncbi:toxin-activating lysine-acyltransferase [Phaeobacter inhibens]|nr:toxin-activating lysine-acyltransferase [Phaeobacter inhibens]